MPTLVQRQVLAPSPGARTRGWNPGRVFPLGTPGGSVDDVAVAVALPGHEPKLRKSCITSP